MAERTAIHCGVLIDGRVDEPLPEAVATVKDGRIVECGSYETTEMGDAEVLNHSEETVMPGMIDAHTYLKGWQLMDQSDYLSHDVAAVAARATVHLRDLLSAGVTAVRDVDSRTGLGLKKAVEKVDRRTTSVHERPSNLPDWRSR